MSSFVYCPGCGKKSTWKTECEHCGYGIKAAQHKWGNSMRLVFCDKPGCGCHYTNYCPTHGDPEESESETPTNPEWPVKQ